MATIYKKGTGAASAANSWNSQADGLGTDYTASNPGDGYYIVNDAGNTLDWNGQAFSLDISMRAALFQATTGAATVSGTITLQGPFTYSGTSTSGGITYGTGVAITINGTVTNSSSGYALVGSGSGVLTISNVGGTAVDNSGSGRGISHQSTGNLAITGGVVNSSTGRGISITAACTSSVTCDISATGGFGLIVTSGATSGTCTIAGNLTSANAVAISNTGTSGATILWIGSRTHAASSDCYITLSSGTLALADGSGALALANSGTFTIYKTGGTLTTTSGANTASIVNQTATSYAAIIGGTDANKAIITGASIPSAADTRYGATRGWADGGTGATAGCGVAGGNGLLEIPNSSSPTGTQDATSDACVVSGKKYGSPQRTGSASSGYTYGDEDPDLVLTTADGAGNYEPPDPGDVRFGVDVGTTTGTLMGIVDSLGVLHGPGLLDNAGAWYSIGIMASDGYHDAGALEVLGTWYSTDYVTESGGGTYHEPSTGEVQFGVEYGPNSSFIGEYVGGGGGGGVILVGMSGGMNG